MVQELFNVHYPNESHYLELKQEVVLERGYFAGKRRYAQFIVNKEGVPVEELDLKGLDLMKSNFPPLFKQFGENLIKQIMFGKSKPSIDSQILDFRESLQTIEWKKILNIVKSNRNTSSAIESIVILRPDRYSRNLVL
jgi:DNA polymerase elongation subunit (family B)